MAHYYIPTNDLEFEVWLCYLVEYVLARVLTAQPVWTHIPVTEAEVLAAAYTLWHTAYLPTLKPHTPIDTKAKNSAKKTATKVAQLFVNRFLRYPPVTNEDRAAMRIPNQDEHPSPIKPSETGPLFSISIVGPGTLGIVFRNGDKGRKGSKPHGVEGVRIYYGFEPVTNQKYLPFSEWGTKCPHLLRFPEEDRGKRVYIALQWEIRKEHGESPWSEIQSELVP
jgi:hypothetical protein